MKPNLFINLLSMYSFETDSFFFVDHLMQHEIVWRVFYLNNNIRENHSLIEKLFPHVLLLVIQDRELKLLQPRDQDFLGYSSPELIE